MERNNLLNNGRIDGEHFALFLENLRDLSVFMRKTISSEFEDDFKEVLDNKLETLKKNRRKARKMEGNEDVDLFVNISQFLEKTIRLSFLISNDLDIEDILDMINSSFGNLKKIYGMKGVDTIKSVKMARKIEKNMSKAKKQCYMVLKKKTSEKGNNKFKIELLEKLLDVVYEMELLSDHFIVSVDSRIK
ncbi:MAG: hypothetical protein ABEK17_04650 [Candidatus Aenigmatarchaeota archaeon]